MVKKNAPASRRPSRKAAVEVGASPVLLDAISFLTIRKFIGYLGTAMPFVVFLGARVIFQTSLQASLSGYYYTPMRDVFVGILWAIGVFLFANTAYEFRDKVASKLAGAFALGVTLFPTAPQVLPSASQLRIGYFHFAFAALFFLTLIYMSMFRFTKTDPKKAPTKQKLRRNRVYRTGGVIMFLSILLGSFFSLPAGQASPLLVYQPIFWLEAIAIVAFGFSWLVKGEALWSDQVRP